MRQRPLRSYLPWRICSLMMIAVFIALVIAGCGGKDDKSPFGQALSYVPEESPLVVAFNTDTDGSQFKDIEALINEVPVAKNGRDELIEKALDQMKADDVDFDKDIKPLLGNKAVLSAPDVEGLEGEDQTFILSYVTKDEKVLDDLLKSGKLDLKKPTKYKDVNVYKDKDGDSVLAVNGPDIVIADDQATIEEAIDTNKSDSSFSEEDFDKAQPGSSSSYLAAVYVNAKVFIADSTKAKSVAEKVPWVGALTTVGVTLGVDGDDIELQYKVDTTGAELKEEDLPLAPGAKNPQLNEFVKDSTGSSGIRNLARTVRFIEKVAKELDPENETEIDQFKQQLKTSVGIDVDEDIVEQLTGDLQMLTTVDGGSGVILDVTDAASMQETLKQIQPLIMQFLLGAGLTDYKIDESKEGESTIYSVSDGSKDVAEFGVVSGELLLAISPTTIDDLRPDNLKPVGKIGPGSVIAETDVLTIVKAVLSSIENQGSFDDESKVAADILTEIDRAFDSIKATSSTETSVAGIEGELKLTFD